MGRKKPAATGEHVDVECIELAVAMMNAKMNAKGAPTFASKPESLRATVDLALALQRSAKR